MLALLMFSQCAKDPIRGCLDPKSTNYCSSCDTDDGSCMYEGYVVFYPNQAAAQFLVNDGATVLRYYINGFLVGSDVAGTYFDSEPSCTTTDATTATIFMTGTSAVANIRVIDQTDFEYFTSTQTIYANDCNVIPIFR